MNINIDHRLGLLAQAGQLHLLNGGLKGLEKESLRITPEGRVAQTPHPHDLGAALTHPWITTDYSEALIELITPPFADAADTLDFMAELHRFVYRHIGDESLLATSMPCEIDGDASIPIAEYGRSNIGKLKRVYRQGLQWRYGRAMQAIAGIHFNYSVNEALWPALREALGIKQSLEHFVSDQYFGLIRNIHRHGWLILYLYGASPAFCASFFKGRETLAQGFPTLGPATLFRPHATSLRMSDIGYRNDSQAGLEICFNHLEAYVASLSRAIHTPYPAYEKIGVKVDGEYRQLNGNILQIENEYYSPVRPKQIALSGEKPTAALRRRGIRYVELRSVDLDCYAPAGASADQLRLLEVFLLTCLLLESPALSHEEKSVCDRNALSVACCGRTPGFTLQRRGGPVGLKSWAGELAAAMTAVAHAMDDGKDTKPYVDSLRRLNEVLADDENTPSARVLADLQREKLSFGEYALNLSKGHAAGFRAQVPRDEFCEKLRQEARESWDEQARIEAADDVDFDTFLHRYLAQP
ncbi:glutamate--cysteine ligase [Methylococcus sp. EFPC2]|uniref:glutamate--cysteine ligase n=1 Tax=Methylococcus sp. EFPC2 TaxID=2812648 RepID=UPI0019672766|nr:glutamate--cysteine ligase [Methylococcus sp. EFPC2]QSA98211.1 glutamate--cysteine ligase [Methylococcus sp. EFPC2]